MGSIFTISRLFTSVLVILANFSSVISKPAVIKSSPFLSLMVLEIYFPIIWSFEIKIYCKPFSWSFFAIIKLSFSPFERIFLLFFESIKSYDSLIGLL